MNNGSPPVVVKLGGSIMRGGDLDLVCASVLRAMRPKVVVCGGGPFADAVRSAQAALRFSDGLAHRLAIRAMGAFAQILCERDARFVLAPTRREIEAALAAGATPVWDACELIGHPDVPESWDITSDSLAAWLARALGAAALVLVKSAPSPSRRMSAQALMRAGMLDDAFGALSRDFAGKVLCAGRGDWGDLASIIDTLPARFALEPPSAAPGLAVERRGSP